MKMSNEVIKGIYRALTEKASFKREGKILQTFTGVIFSPLPVV